jgi:hypothetical protein
MFADDDKYFEEWRQFWATNKIAHSNAVALRRDAQAWKQFSLTNKETADHLDPNTFFSEQQALGQAEWQQFWARSPIPRSNIVALINQPEAWRRFAETNSEATDYFMHLEPARVPTLLRLPEGMQFVLLREIICLDDQGEMVPTHVVESVQFHTQSRIDQSGIERTTGRELELSRTLLFEGKQGGLRTVARNEPRTSFYNNLGHLRVDENGNGPSLSPFPKSCTFCHTSNQMMTPGVEFSTPSRSASIAPVIRWKESSGKLDLLRSMMLGR